MTQSIFYLLTYIDIYQITEATFRSTSSVVILSNNNNIISFPLRMRNVFPPETSIYYILSYFESIKEIYDMK